MKSRLKILLTVLAVIGLLIWLAIPGGGPRREVEAYKAKLLARGEKLTMKELAPRTTPEGIAAAKNFMNLMSGYQEPTNYPVAMAFHSPDVASIHHTNIPPAGLEDYPSNLVRLVALSEIFKAPVLDFDPDYSRGVQMMQPNLSVIRKSARMLSITALQALHEKDHDVALSSLLAGADLVRLFRNEPVMISQLVRFASERIMIAAAWEALQDDGWTDNQLAELQARWEAVDMITILEDTLVMERAFTIAQFVDRRKESYSQANSVSFQLAEDAGETGLRLQLTKIRAAYQFWRWKTSKSYVEELAQMQAIEVAADTARRFRTNEPYYENLDALKQTVDNISKKFGFEGDDASELLSDTGNIYSLFFQRIAQSESARRLLITAIALKRYKLQHGAYPSTPTELTPTLLKQVPLDPWDAKPLRYKLKPDESFALYSISQNGKDDGGDASYGGTGSKIDWTAGKDIVWPRAATPAEAATANSTNGVGSAPK